MGGRLRKPVLVSQRLSHEALEFGRDLIRISEARIPWLSIGTSSFEMLYSGLLSLSLISTALAAAVAGKSSFKLKDEIAVPYGWSQTHERIEKSKLMDLRIGLVQQNIDEAQSMLHEISNPRHRKYGRYLSKAEIRELLAPSAESVDKVMDWLTNHHKIAKHNIAQVGDFIHCKVSVATAEKMLDTEYNMYHSKGKKVARALHYSLPYDLHDHIELVQPTTMFGSMHAHAKDLIRIDGSAYRTAARLPVFRRADASYNGEKFAKNSIIANRSSLDKFSEESVQYRKLHCPE